MSLCIAGQLSNIGEHRAMIPLVSSCQTTVEAHKDTTKLSMLPLAEGSPLMSRLASCTNTSVPLRVIGTDTSLLQLSEPPEMFSVVPRIRLEDTLVAVRENIPLVSTMGTSAMANPLLPTGDAAMQVASHVPLPVTMATPSASTNLYLTTYPTMPVTYPLDTVSLMYPGGFYYTT